MCSYYLQMAELKEWVRDINAEFSEVEKHELAVVCDR